MADKVTLDRNKLTIELSETDARIYKKTISIASVFASIFATAIARFLLAIAMTSKDELFSALTRIQEGEDSSQVAAELMSKSGINLTSIFENIEMPLDEEILKALGFGEEE